ATITIEGNTDSIPFIPGTKGPVNNNQVLSMVRALAAKNYLVNKGVTNKFKLIGNGYSKPVAPNTINGKDNPAGRALNRRDDITANSNAPLCVSPTPSLAVPTTTPTPTVTPTPTPSLCKDNSTNSLQGGYTFSPPPTTTTQLIVSSQWNVVGSTCKANEQGFTAWTGIKTNDMLIQAGTYAWCSSTGTVQYFPWTMAYPGPMANPPNVDTVTVGDTMYSSITMDKPGSFIINVMDITKGWSYQVNANDSGFTSLSPNAGQVFVQDEPSQGAQVPPQLSQFSSDVNFTLGQFSINGSPLAPLANAPGLLCHNIIRNKTILEQTSGISQGDFNDAWQQP
ncbi:MAG TPA: OmpA family protein, partial [Bacteroidia bacterium]|nr:OmpA family protein [Bacteroidia bacterium]